MVRAPTRRRARSPSVRWPARRRRNGDLRGHRRLAGAGGGRPRSPTPPRIADDGTNGADPTPGNNTGTDTTPVTAAPDLSVTKSDGGVDRGAGRHRRLHAQLRQRRRLRRHRRRADRDRPGQYDLQRGGVHRRDGLSATGGSTCTLAVGSSPAGGSRDRRLRGHRRHPVAGGHHADRQHRDASPTTAPTAPTRTRRTTPAPTRRRSPPRRTSRSPRPTAAPRRPGRAPSATRSATPTPATRRRPGVVLTETVPAEHDLQRRRLAPPGWACAAGHVHADVGDLAPGGGDGDFAVTVVSPVPAGVTEIANTATVADDGTNGADPTPANNTGTDTDAGDGGPGPVGHQDRRRRSAVAGRHGHLHADLRATPATRRPPASCSPRPCRPTPPSTPAPPTAGWTCAAGTCTSPSAAWPAADRVRHVRRHGGCQPLPAGRDAHLQHRDHRRRRRQRRRPDPGQQHRHRHDAVTAAPDLSVTKTDGGTTATPGVTVTYTLTYTNAGNQAATGVVADRDRAGQHHLQRRRLRRPAGPAPAASCTWPSAPWPAGGSRTATFAVTVAAPLPAGVTAIANTATVADDGANGADPTPANNTGTDTTPVDGRPRPVGHQDRRRRHGGAGRHRRLHADLHQHRQPGAPPASSLTETVPANTTFNAGASDGGWTCANGDVHAGRRHRGRGRRRSRPPSPSPSTRPLPAGVTADLQHGDASPTTAPTAPIRRRATTRHRHHAGDGRARPVGHQDRRRRHSGAGPTVTYTLTYANAGNQAATGVVAHRDRAGQHHVQRRRLAPPVVLRRRPPARSPSARWPRGGSGPPPSPSPSTAPVAGGVTGDHQHGHRRRRRRQRHRPDPGEQHRHRHRRR